MSRDIGKRQVWSCGDFRDAFTYFASIQSQFACCSVGPSPSMASLPAVALLTSAALVLLLVIARVEGGAGGEWSLSNQREFDYFKLTLQWPGTLCRRTRYCCPSNACCRGYVIPLLSCVDRWWQLISESPGGPIVFLAC